MGKRLIQQRRGRGSFTYKAHSHRWKGKIEYRLYDEKEKNIVKGRIVDFIHSSVHAPLANIQYETGECILIPAATGLRIDDEVATGDNADVKIGNTLPLRNIPEGASIFNIESRPGKPSFCRSSGSFAKIIAKFEDKIVIRLPSKKQKSLNPNCRATIGIVAGSGKKEKPFVKAGKRWHLMKAKGKLYPRTSGVAMNAVDHPFGSGRGRHIGKSKNAPRHAPPGRNVGLIRSRRTGKRK